MKLSEVKAVKIMLEKLCEPCELNRSSLFQNKNSFTLRELNEMFELMKEIGLEFGLGDSRNDAANFDTVKAFLREADSEIHFHLFSSQSLSEPFLRAIRNFLKLYAGKNNISKNQEAFILKVLNSYERKECKVFKLFIVNNRAEALIKNFLIKWLQEF